MIYMIAFTAAVGSKWGIMEYHETSPCIVECCNDYNSQDYKNQLGGFIYQRK